LNAQRRGVGAWLPANVTGADDCQVTILTRSSRPERLLDRRMALNQRAAVRRYLARQL
jgi:hypothetical protein